MKEIDTEFGKGRVGTLDDGSNVVVRPGSKGKNGVTGPPTLELQKKDSPEKTKIRYK
ncbi:hypothetical protein RU86_GL001820 [Lactococcus piscium]|uniref:Uncharacterized protein n=1 Tax=Pseudolactococcus piscium TaxID=1364 RepID=A0A2A5RTE4_9LACT|nr:hypothetical protein [Lactococcus piscium]PCS03298.1 hypothetical protein RU86_GL001820 [Lactococcus piscium]